jgi:putative PIN family toxin of toxin-antitoxin system
MKNKVSRIIIDTNLLISFLITKNFTRLDEIIFSKKCVLIFSQELLEEFLTVAKRPKFRRFFSSSEIEEIIRDNSRICGICRSYKQNSSL